jgi:hypothetical protein
VMSCMWQAEADEIRGAYLAEPTARLAASQAELQEALDAPHGLPQEVWTCALTCFQIAIKYTMCLCADA